MLITALATLGAAVIAILYWWDLGWPESAGALWLAVLVSVFAWLAEGWHLNALEWATAYDRDMLLCQQPRSPPFQLPQSIQLSWPKTYSDDQTLFRWTASAELIRGKCSRSAILDSPTDSGPQRTRNIDTDASFLRAVLLVDSLDYNSHRTAAGYPGVSLSFGLSEGNPKNHTESEAIPIGRCWASLVLVI